jgi:DNA-directed RNA polymerase subunit RPC12/RpoP
MIPPLVRRCPDCGYLGLSARFATLETDEGRRIECPSCGCRIDPIDDPWLN